ncbi:hypothetical protein K456DRAFT_481654 [Colletotrichum gloeosporioides 23]|nr:hypothetical protein K456DRAFT_481654 [Colletotrichum gloeosporioides 23]
MGWLTVYLASVVIVVALRRGMTPPTSISHRCNISFSRQSAAAGDPHYGEDRDVRAPTASPFSWLSVSLVRSWGYVIRPISLAARHSNTHPSISRSTGNEGSETINLPK